MTGTKHREAIFQHWKSAIVRESRDLASLDQTGARALADPDVRADPTLESMIRSEVAERKAEFAQKNSPQEQPTAPTSYVTGPSNPEGDALAVFHRLAQEFDEAIKRGDQFTARELLSRMQLLKSENSAANSLSLAEFEGEIARLADHSRLLQEEVTSVTAEALEAARQGEDSRVAQLLHRLTTMHATQPALIDTARLDQIRRDVAVAAQDDLHRKAARRILERERVIAAELTNLAGAVHTLRKAVRGTSPESAPSAGEKENPSYRIVARQVEEHGPNWLAGIILELADLLAEWEHPPHEAQHQVDRFVDGVEKGLKQIRAELRQIQRGRAGVAPPANNP